MCIDNRIASCPSLPVTEKFPTHESFRLNTEIPQATKDPWSPELALITPQVFITSPLTSYSQEAHVQIP